MTIIIYGFINVVLLIFVFVETQTTTSDAGEKETRHCVEEVFRGCR